MKKKIIYALLIVGIIGGAGYYIRTNKSFV